MMTRKQKEECSARFMQAFGLTRKMASAMIRKATLEVVLFDAGAVAPDERVTEWEGHPVEWVVAEQAGRRPLGTAA